MKSKTWKTAGLVIALCSSAAMAREGGITNAAPAVKGQKSGPEKMLKQFDADGDGTLSEDELQAMHEAMPKHRNRNAGPPRHRPNHKEIMKRFDADGDGVISEAEREAMHAERDRLREENRKRFDADGDGVISEAEREAMHAERERLREENRKRFDADGDGQLSEEERRTMHETLREERPGPPPEQGGNK